MKGGIHTILVSLEKKRYPDSCEDTGITWKREGVVTGLDVESVGAYNHVHKEAWPKVG